LAQDKSLCIEKGLYMSYEAKILADSLSPDGDRLTTLEVVLPRVVIAEFNTHRMFSRNSASSRAIPVEKMLKRVEENPFIPIYWGKNQKGMQADVELSQSEQRVAEHNWLKARDSAVKHARQLLEIGVHKQITNRLIEPWLWHTVIVSATEWDNFFALRTHKDAQPEIRKAAVLMKEAYDASNPRKLTFDQWHLPLVAEDESWPTDGITHYSIGDICKVSAGRCARVSYLTHDGRRDPAEDIKLCERLTQSGHMSPLEHVARPMTRYDIGQMGINASTHFLGNFRGWVSLRKLIANEDNYAKAVKNQ
jgi:thymidylate synthase ThyX